MLSAVLAMVAMCDIFVCKDCRVSAD